MKNPDQHTTNRRKQTSVSMALGIGIGLTLGAALDNLAAGLAIGIIIGGVGSAWRIREADGNPDGNEEIKR